MNWVKGTIFTIVDWTLTFVWPAMTTFYLFEEIDVSIIRNYLDGLRRKYSVVENVFLPFVIWLSAIWHHSFSAKKKTNTKELIN